MAPYLKTKKINIKLLGCQILSLSVNCSHLSHEGYSIKINIYRILFKACNKFRQQSQSNKKL